MPDLRSRFLAAAVRPLHDNAEQKLAATQMLDALCPPSGEDAERAVERWDAIDARPRRPLARIFLFVVLAVVSTVVLVSTVRQALAVRPVSDWLSGGARHSSDPADWIGDDIPAEQKLLMLCDPSLGNMVERSKALWDSQPENPAYFADYVSAFQNETGKLPEDFLETARRLDPDNSWFTYLAAQKLVEGTYRDDDSKWEISDPKKFGEAMTLFHEASGRPKFESYQTVMLSQRIPWLPHADFLDGLRSTIALNKLVTIRNHTISFLVAPIAAKAWQLGETRDITGFHELSKDADMLLSRMLSSTAPSLVEGVIARNSAQILMEELGKTAKKLGLAEQADRRLKLADHVSQLKVGAMNRESDPGPTGLIVRSGILIREYLKNPRFALHPPVPTEADVRPGRLVEHELLSQVGSVGACLLVGLALAGAVLFQFRVSRLVRRLGVRAASLLRPVDYAWIFGLGVMLPTAFTLAIQRLTPLGGRDFGLQANDLQILDSTPFPIPLAQFVGLAVLLIIAPLLVARWRLGVRDGSLGFSTRASWADRIAVICAAGFIPVIGWEIPVEVKSSIYPVLGILALAVLWLAAVAGRALTSNSETLFHRSATARVLESAYGFAMLLLILAVPVFKSAERHYFRQDRLMNYDPAKPALFPYEYDLAQEVMRELREAVEMNPQPSAE